MKSLIEKAQLLVWNTPLLWRRWKPSVLAIGVVIGVLMVGVTTAVVSGAGSTNAEAERVREAEVALRTNRWLAERHLDPSRSDDMRQALELACRELELRGEAC